MPLRISKTPGAEVCASFTVHCTARQAGCTGNEISKQTVFKWMYASMSAASCKPYASLNSTDGSNQFGNVTCCSESLCNKPNPVLDPHAHFLNQPTSAADAVAIPHMLGLWFALLLAAALGSMQNPAWFSTRLHTLGIHTALSSSYKDTGLPGNQYAD